MLFECFGTKKRSHWDCPCCHHLLDPDVRDDPREDQESLHVCGFLSGVYCIPSRTVYTGRTYQHPLSGSRAWDLIAKKRILSCTRSRVSGSILKISTMSMTNEDEKDLDDFTAENREIPSASLVGACRAKSTEQCQQEVESQQRFHLFLMDQPLGSSTKSWSTTVRILQCLNQKNEVQHWKTDLSETQKCTRDFLKVCIWWPPID